jgi:penicillin-binding protein 1A
VVFANGQIDRNASFRENKPKQVIPDWVAAETTRILQANVVGGTGGAATLSNGWRAAGKTGTTDNHTDAWFTGYTPKYATAVWVGYPNSTQKRMLGVHGINVAGGTFPAQIWGAYMNAVLAKDSPTGFPAPKKSPSWEPWQGQYAFTGDPTEPDETEPGETDKKPKNPKPDERPADEPPAEPAPAETPPEESPAPAPEPDPPSAPTPAPVPAPPPPPEPTPTPDPPPA